MTVGMPVVMVIIAMAGVTVVIIVVTGITVVIVVVII